MHGVLDWSARAVEKFQIPVTRPSGFYCHRHVFASSPDHAASKVLVDVRSYYEDTTDWFVSDLVDFKLEVDEIKTAPFYKGLFKDNLGATFYPWKAKSASPQFLPFQPPGADPKSRPEGSDPWRTLGA